MATELAGIRRAIRDPDRRGVLFAVTGVGKSATISRLSKVIVTGPEAIIMVGFCGASDPGLETGDLHIAGGYIRAEATDCRASAADGALSPPLIAAAQRNGTVISSAPSATVNEVVGSDLKAELRASAGVASVNMEDYWAAETARTAAVPFASVRAVLDTADQDLPRWLSGYADHAGKSAWGLITHPGRAPAMARLARQAHRARRSLTRCVVDAVEAGVLTETALAQVAR